MILEMGVLFCCCLEGLQANHMGLYESCYCALSFCLSTVY